MSAQVSTQDQPNTLEFIEHTRQTIKEIRLELDDPTQQVREISGCCASEENSINYLRCMAILGEPAQEARHQCLTTA